MTCSGDGARGNSGTGPFQSLIPSCRQLCTLHHGSVPGNLWDAHLKKPTFVKDLVGNTPTLRPIRLVRKRHANAPAKDQRIQWQAQPMAAHLHNLTLPAKGAKRQWVISRHFARCSDDRKYILRHASIVRRLHIQPVLQQNALQLRSRPFVLQPPLRSIHLVLLLPNHVLLHRRLRLV